MALSKMTNKLLANGREILVPIRNGSRPAPMPEMMKSTIGTALSLKGGAEYAVQKAR